MEAHEYRTLYDLESVYWWFHALHGVILDTLRDNGIGPDARILDAGCGTGRNLEIIAERITENGFGFDIAAETAQFWARRGLQNVCRASINEIPFHENAFDALVSVDVLECEAVDEHRAVREATRVLKPGGLLLLWLPAYQFLMTPEHHKAVGAVRRYDKAGIRTLLDGEPLRIIRMTHVFAALFPAIAAFRLAVRALPRNDDQAPRSELNPLPGAVNGLLTWIMTVERRVLRYVDLPFGSSILTVCRKAE